MCDNEEEDNTKDDFVGRKLVQTLQRPLTQCRLLEEVGGAFWVKLVRFTGGRMIRALLLIVAKSSRGVSAICFLTCSSNSVISNQLNHLNELPPEAYHG